MQQLYDPKAAARKLCVHPRTLWNHTTPRGSIPVVRIGRLVRYSDEALAEWIEKQASLEGPAAD